MADSEDIKKLLFTFKRIADALEGSSMVGSQYQVRAGRGGNSNGSTAGKSLDYDTTALKKANDDLAKAVRRNVDPFKRWEAAARKATGAAESLETTLDRLEDSVSGSNAATRRVTESTLRMSKQQKISTTAISAMTEKSLSYTETLRKLTMQQEARIELEKAHQEADKKIADVNAKLSRANTHKAKKQLQEELRQAKAEKDSLESLQDFDKNIAKTAAELFKLGQQIDRNTNPAFNNLQTKLLEAQSANELATKSVKDLSEAHNEMRPLVKAQSNATRELINQEQKQVEAVEKAREGIISAMKGIAKAVPGMAGMMVDNFRSQLKYNVKDSHYMNAAGMGLSDGELSQFLGENAQMLRYMNGNGNNTAMLDGRIQGLQKQVTALYGVSGPAAMQTLAEAGTTLQQAGINLKDAPQALGRSLSDVSAMADRLGMVKGDLLEFQKNLASAGDLAYMTAKYQNLGADKAQQAMERELEARIANAKVLGLSTEFVKKQIELERANRYGTMENQIKNLIGSKMDISMAQKSGVNVTPEMARARQKQALGQRLDQNDIAALDRFNFLARDQHEKALQRADKANDTNGLLKLGAQRQISGMFGSDMYNMDEYQQQKAALANLSPQERQQYLSGGAIPESVRKKMSDAGDPNAFGGIMQLFNRGATIKEGLEKNPLSKIANDVGDILFYTKIIAGENGISAAKNLFGGGGGGGLMGRAAGLFRGGEMSSAMVAARGGIGSELGAAMRVGGRSAGAIGGGVLSAVTGAYDGYTSSKAKGETTGNAVATGAGGAVGGGLGGWGGAAAGAAIGTMIFPGVGTVIGGVIGGMAGGWAGSELGQVAGDAAYDAIADDSGPGSTLAKTTKEAQKQREAEKKPQEVVLAGQQGDALLKSGDNSDKMVDHAKQQTKEAQRANEFKKSASDIKAMFDAQKANISATQQRFADNDM